MWATTDVRPRGKDSPLSEETGKSKNWLDNIPDVNDMFELKSYEELERIINEWLSGDEEESSQETTRGGNKNSFSSSSSSSSSDDSPDAINSKYSSLDDAFADLENL